jgi:hypothetical protein
VKWKLGDADRPLHASAARIIPCGSNMLFEAVSNEVVKIHTRGSTLLERAFNVIRRREPALP